MFAPVKTMAKRKKSETPADDLAGTVEGQARDFFEREKAAVEERTGEKVKFVPPTPTTRTPIKEKTTTAAAEPDVTNADEQAEGDQASGEE